MSIDRGPVTEKAAIFTVRYSLFSWRHAKFWNIGRDSREEYVQRLFAPERLRFRRWTFENITLPSIAETIERNPQVYSELHVLTSTLLPDADKEFLSARCSDYGFLKVFHQHPDAVSLGASTDSICRELPPESAVASIRIDDDDAVSNDYLEQLDPYIRSSMEGYVISLCAGCAAHAREDGRLVGPFPYRWRFGSAGQAFIRTAGNAAGAKSIYGLGNHARTDERFPTVLDGRKPAFLRLIHEGSDSGSTIKFDRNAISPELRDRFALAPSIWADPDDLPHSPAPSRERATESLHGNGPSPKHDLKVKLDRISRERDELKRDLKARRSRIAWWIDYADYLAHAWLANAPFLGPAKRKKLKSSAADRWRPAYSRERDRPGGRSPS